MQIDAYISYSRRDQDFVEMLCQALRDRGFSVWYDKENLTAGDNWRTEIVEVIRDCKVFLLVLSPDSMASMNIRKEVDLADRYQKKILPLMWRRAEIPVAMEYQLAGISWITFNEIASEEKFNEVASLMRRIIDGSSLISVTPQS